MENGEQLHTPPDPIAFVPADLRPFFETPKLLQWTSTAPLGYIHDAMPAETQAHYTTMENWQEACSSIQGLLRACASETDYWRQDHRDTSLKMLDVIGNAVSLETTTSEQKLEIIEAYTNTVQHLESDADYLGAPHSLFEAGVYLAGRIGTTTNQPLAYRAKMSVRAAWSDYYNRSSDHQSKDLINTTIEHSVAAFFPSLENEASSWEWSRQKPPMTGHEAEFHDTFALQTEAGKSFMPYLIVNTPEHQKTMHEAGADPADFWNLGDSHILWESINTLFNRPDLASTCDELNTLLQADLGIGVSDLIENEKLARGLTDHINTAVGKIRLKAMLHSKQPTEMLQRMIEQAQGGVHARKPSKKIAPIKNYLAQLGLRSDQLPEKLLADLQDPVFQADFLSSIEAQNKKEQARTETLLELFPEKPYDNFVIGRRDHYDLVAGDYTRDCTAYHLTCGFNGNTVPMWLSNPAFELAYIQVGQARLAKIGLLLAHDGGQPRVVIDSLEVFKDLPVATEEAIFFINHGIMQIQEWADKRGYGDVLFCTYTNSSELNTSLPYKPNSKSLPNLTALGSRQGLTEILNSIPKQYRYTQHDEAQEIGYLQSAKTQREGNGGEEQLADAEDVDIQYIESALMHTRDEKLFEAARAGDENEVISRFIQKTMPTLHKLFGNNVALYTQGFRDEQTLKLFTEEDEWFNAGDERSSGAEPDLLWHSDNAIFSFFTKVIEHINNDNQAVLRLLKTSEPVDQDHLKGMFFEKLEDETLDSDDEDDDSLPGSYKLVLNAKEEAYLNFVHSANVIADITPLDTKIGQQRLEDEAARLDKFTHVILSAQRIRSFAGILRFLFNTEADARDGTLAHNLQIVKRQDYI